MSELNMRERRYPEEQRQQLIVEHLVNKILDERLAPLEERLSLVERRLAILEGK